LRAAMPRDNTVTQTKLNNTLHTLSLDKFIAHRPAVSYRYMSSSLAPTGKP
jgi:hypothetical protein